LTGRLVRLKLRKGCRDRSKAVAHLVRYAKRHIPFYAELYRNVDAEAIASADDLRRLPVARRTNLLSGGHLRRGAAPGNLNRRSTTGTSGEPLTVFSSGAEAFFRKASLLDAFRRNTGLRFPLRIADVGVEEGKFGSDIAQRLGLVKVDRILRTWSLAEQVEHFCRLSPDIVEGRATSLSELAEAVRQSGRACPTPRLVASFAEALYPHTRRALEAAFGCRVSDYYNCEEVGNVAWDCPQSPGTMHVNGATAVLEIANGNGEPMPVGEIGDVLLTNLYNWTMPFIRYAIRDRAMSLGESACECGFRGQSIQLLEGRDEDFFQLPDGSEVSPRVAYEAVAGILPFEELGNELFHAIQAFQIVQESIDRILVNVVPGPAYAESLWEGVDASAKSLHSRMQVEVRCVPSLETGPGGKFRQVMSRIPRHRETGESR